MVFQNETQAKVINLFSINTQRAPCALQACSTPVNPDPFDPLEEFFPTDPPLRPHTHIPPHPLSLLKH